MIENEEKWKLIRVETERVLAERGLTRRDLVGPCRTIKAVNARAAVAQALKEKGLSHRAIGLVIKRDRNSVRHLLGREVQPPGADPQVCLTEAERMSAEMRRRGSAALLLAIFATGKTHGPVSPERQLAAVEWAQRHRGPLELKWMD
jgi:hypothetical protein